MNEEIIPSNADEVGCDCGVCDKCMNKDMVGTSPVAENPSENLNPAVGMKHPELHNPNDPMCKCQKCMTTKAACTPDSPDCGDGMCTKCMNKSIDIWDGTGFGKRNFNSKQRRAAAASGAAMPDGSFPISNAKDLANAIRLYGHASNPAAAKAHIKARAAALGITDALPENW